MLTSALGEDKAGNVIDRILLGKNSKGLDSLKWMDPRAVAGVVQFFLPPLVVHQIVAMGKSDDQRVVTAKVSQFHRTTKRVVTGVHCSSVIQELAGEHNYHAMKAAVMEVVGQHFRPEFINRVDETVVFHPLVQEQIRAIADIQIEHLRRRLVAQDMGIELTDAALDKLAEAGFDPVYGARPLKRAIQNQIENPLAQRILGGDFGPGDVIQVDVSGGELGFRRKA